MTHVSALPGAFGREDKYRTAQYPKTAAYLDSIGLRPETISIDEITASGYRRIILDSQGKRMVRGDSLRTLFRRWPTGVAIEVLFGMAYEDLMR